MARQVIFDTDIGIDDAMALLFLHYARHVQLAAIISGFGNASVEITTRNALFIRDRFGIDTPVFRGAGEPLGPRLGDGYPDFVHGSNGLGDIDIPETFSQAEDEFGPDAIVRLASERPGELSIVAVGRLTNLALALDRCPALPSLVREVVIMGGAFGYNGHRGNVSPVAEANIAGDPVAADRVLTSGLPITVVGLDVTQETVATNAFFRALRDGAGDAGRFIFDISRFYLEFHQSLHGELQCPVHDSSAVAFLLRPRLFKTVEGSVRVVTGGVAMGQTILGEPGRRYESDAWDGLATCRVCTAVDAAGLLAMYQETLGLASD